MKKLVLHVSCVLSIFLSSNVFAGPSYRFGFNWIQPHDAADITANAETGEAQLRMDVTQYINDTVLFTFLNTGPHSSSITNIYFDDMDNPEDQILTGIQLIDHPDTGTSFSQETVASNLPAGESIDFTATQGFTFYSLDQASGINPGESLSIRLDVSSLDIITRLIDGSLRIGLHAQGFSNNGSESFVNATHVSAIPEPSTAILFYSGIIVLARNRRKK